MNLYKPVSYMNLYKPVSCMNLYKPKGKQRKRWRYLVGNFYQHSAEPPAHFPYISLTKDVVTCWWMCGKWLAEDSQKDPGVIVCGNNTRKIKQGVVLRHKQMFIVQTADIHPDFLSPHSPLNVVFENNRTHQIHHLDRQQHIPCIESVLCLMPSFWWGGVGGERMGIMDGLNKGWRCQVALVAGYNKEISRCCITMYGIYLLFWVFFFSI